MRTSISTRLQSFSGFLAGVLARGFSGFGKGCADYGRQLSHFAPLAV